MMAGLFFEASGQGLPVGYRYGLCGGLWSPAYSRARKTTASNALAAAAWAASPGNSSAI